MDTLDTQPIRSFIAIELPEDVRAGLRRIQDELHLPGHNFVKWVFPDGIHLTLKFLGNISPLKVADVSKVMKDASVGTSTFSLTVSGLGAFPNLQRPRVLWVGVGGELDKLVTLQQRIDSGLGVLGFAPEKRPFAPHLTLARLREGTSPDRLREFGALVAKKPMAVGYDFVVNSINLMKSVLMPTGAVYNCLTKVELKR